MMKKPFRIAVVGYGNIGRYAVEAVEAAEDCVLTGVVRRNPTEKPAHLAAYPVAASLSELPETDVAILATPTREVETHALAALAAGINTVDSFDIHGDIPGLRRRLATAAKLSGRVAVLAAGWDPGTDSVVRAVMQAALPEGITYTDFGPGMSMGHSVAARAIEGVRDALSMTIPLGTSLHRRMVYVETEEGADKTRVESLLRADDYFAHDETHLIFVPSVASLRDMGHGVEMSRKGVSGITHNQRMRFSMEINNPALTSQVMLAAARASMRLTPGAYTLPEVPPIDLLPGERDEWISRLV